MSSLIGREYRCFEDIKQLRANGTEFWSARELAVVLDYTKWENFAKVIKRAQIACENSGRSISDHFPEVRKMIEIAKGKTAQRQCGGRYGSHFRSSFRRQRSPRGNRKDRRHYARRFTDSRKEHCSA